VYASLAAVESALAAYNGNHGVDPMPAVTLGERNLRAAIAIDDSAVWRYSLGRLWIAVAHYQDDRGQDPERAIVRVLSELELSTRMDATRADAWATRAEALILRARQQRADHVDTTSTLAAARAALERALEISPTMAAPLRHRMALAELDAEALLEHHADPGAAVARIRADAQALLARVPNDGVSHRLWCSAELLAARWAVAHGNPVEPLLVQAARHATQARETDPMDPRAWVASAAVEQLRAGAAHARGTPTDASIARGLAFAERALALAPGLVCARVVRDNLQRAR
jgi:tetratricopeptide (TPR) repeat protein